MVYPTHALFCGFVCWWKDILIALLRKCFKIIYGLREDLLSGRHEKIILPPNAQWSTLLSATPRF